MTILQEQKTISMHTELINNEEYIVIEQSDNKIYIAMDNLRTFLSKTKTELSAMGF